MSRYANSNGSRNSHGNVNLAICSTVLGKEVHYRKGLSTNQALTKLFAERLMPESGTLENALVNLLPSGDNNGSPTEESKTELKTFLQEQREKLQKISLRTAEAELETEAFLAAIRNLREQFLAQASNEDNGGNAGADLDVEAVLAAHMNQTMSQRNPAEENEKYHTVCEMLGFEVQRKRKAQNGDDDDVEEVRNTAHGNATQATGSQALRVPKCPITAMDMVDPVKNTYCSHNYSRVGIEQLIRQGHGKCQCPIAGCQNRTVTNQQLENDLEMELTVKRAQLRQENAKKQQQSQNADLVDTDEEE